MVKMKGVRKVLHHAGHEKNNHVQSTVRGRVYRIPVIGGKESYFSDLLMCQVVGVYSIRPPDATDGGEYMSCVRPPNVPAKGTNADTRLYRRLFHDNHPSPIVPDWGRMQYAPTLTVEKTGSFFEPIRFRRYLFGRKMGTVWV